MAMRHTAAVFTAGIDLRVDPNHRTLFVKERPAGVAGIDRGVGLKCELSIVRPLGARILPPVGRPRPEITPVVRVRASPNGLPMRQD